MDGRKKEMKFRNPSEVKILVYGHEIGGQMQLLADKFRHRWIKATAVASNDDFRGYQNDINVCGTSFREKLGKFIFSVWAIIHFDIFHFFWGVSLWSVWRFHLIDLPLLKFLGKTVVVHFRGLDIVDIRYFDYKRTIARGEAVEKPAMSRADQLKKLRKWQRYADAILVSEPDLHFASPDSILSPQIIDLDYWSGDWQPKSREDGIVRIVHAPSSRRKKGTDFIVQAIETLKSKGYRVELVLAENLGHHKVKELYCMSDVGIDQVLYGWHGKVSVEMMAVGLPTVCHIDEEYRKYRSNLPIVDASPATLVERLEMLIANPALREELSRKSREFVARYHDVEVILDQLTDIYCLDAKTARQDQIADAKTW